MYCSTPPAESHSLQTPYKPVVAMSRTGWKQNDDKTEALLCRRGRNSSSVVCPQSHIKMGKPASPFCPPSRIWDSLSLKMSSSRHLTSTQFLCLQAIKTKVFKKN